MKVAKWGNSLAIRIPKALAVELSLKEGDSVTLTKTKGGVALAKDDARAKALKWIRSRKWKLPEGYKFDREEANRRK
ncbi:MAG TPA: AbrB family transcriptional regulator [Alphaproteobacteria bacterium]|nr:AbrB family transcriptional regulator [Alphaproteobacteria bacterium]HAJ46199.1 AbrB family transcriptional regulator [Alphaproteobacteria bacterium]